MKVLIAIDAPNHSTRAWGRAAQAERTSIGKMVRLLAERIELGQSEGTLAGDAGASLHWKIEQSPHAREE
jgi:hypothetical protein